MNVCVLLNPAAGRGTSAARVRAAVQRLPGVELRVSQEPGGVARLAAEAAAEGFETLVAAGGDGTLAELLDGAQDFLGRLRIGLIPLGIGNDLARALGVPRRLERAVEVVRAGRTRTLDVARAVGVRRRHFGNALVAGFAGRIDERLPRPSGRWGALAYLRAAAGELAKLRPHELFLTLDGEERVALECLMLIVANGPTVGGGIPLAPQARLDDGWLDIVAICAQPPLALLRLVPRALRGRHLHAAGVWTRRVREVRIECGKARGERAGGDISGPCLALGINVDGEILEPGPVTVTVLPGATRMIVGPPGA